jgi:hypothetical protein
MAESNTTVPGGNVVNALDRPGLAVNQSSIGGSSTRTPSADFEIQGGEVGVRQQVAKLTARANASKVPDAEVKALYAERQQLVKKQLEGTITDMEKIRLDYVRWSVDRIDDGKHGRSLDQLESHIAEFGKLANQLRQLHEGLSQAAKHPGGKRR